MARHFHAVYSWRADRDLPDFAGRGRERLAVSKQHELPFGGQQDRQTQIRLKNHLITHDAQHPMPILGHE